jgi:NADPH:quinone reductase-like Zn-dependent oxidoreductase
MRVYELDLTKRSIDGLANNEQPVARPGPGEVRVRLRAASLNFRDLLIAKGLYPAASGRERVIPVSDGAGEVVEVGNGVTRFGPGSRVMGSFFQQWIDGPLTYPAMGSSLGGGVDGVLSEYFVLAEQGLVEIPADVSFEQAATLPCAGVTAWHALVESGQLRAGQWVLVLGTGGVSIFGLQIAKALGARVIVTSSSDEKLAKAKELGADAVVNYKVTPDWGQEVLKLTDGHGADHVLEVGGAGTLPKSMEAVAIHGQVNIIGVLTGLQNNIDFTPVLVKAARLQGIFVGSRTMLERFTQQVVRSRIAPLIDRTFDFNQAHEAYRYMEAAQHVGKIVIRSSAA